MPYLVTVAPPLGPTKQLAEPPDVTVAPPL